MEHRSCKRNQQTHPASPASSAFTEPEMHRWPHPVDGISLPAGRPAPSVGQADLSLYYIHCALSYQNQLLSEIKTLLEQLILGRKPSSEENSG
jgi:hypothetical protein